MPKILVADDNTNIQKMVSLAFSDLGIDVVSVGNGEAAVRRIPDLNPDLVLADIFMPVRNGYEVCEFVKKDTRFSHVPVILLVGAFDPLDEKEARRVGADGVLKKPFVPPDPLIAMVTSALEKNPKIAAEIAKAKEVIPAPAEPVAAVPEAPVKAGIKPLPEFPEPTPEEAALVYGFGTGKRGGEEDSAEQNGPKSPIAPDVEQEEDEGEDRSGSRSWRRNAMDFEVPEETSKNMAFALDDPDPSAMFPSEKDVPPKHVSRSEKDEEKQTRASKFVASSVESVSLTPQIAKPVVAPPAIHQPAPAASGSASSFWSSKPAAPPEPSKAEAPKAEEPGSAEPRSLPRPAAPLAEAPTPLKPVEVLTKTEEPVAIRPVEIEPLSAPTDSPRSSHWLDAVTPSVKAPLNSDLEELKAALNAQEAIAPVPAPEVTQIPVAAAPEPVAKESPKAEDSFFADDLDSAASSLSQPASPSAAEGLVEAAERLERDPVTRSPGISQGADPDWLAEPEAPDPLSQDPDLVVPPAVKVTPEPLLVNEDTPKGGSDYGKVKQERLEQPFEFEAPSCNNEPASVEDAQNERVPTGPPPSREVLAEIPFLSPPPEVLATAAKENNVQPTQPPDVDDMVRKVLEKLTPQLQDLLSQGMLKPIVEDVLQNEIKKK